MVIVFISRQVVIYRYNYVVQDPIEVPLCSTEQVVNRGRCANVSEQTTKEDLRLFEKDHIRHVSVVNNCVSKRRSHMRPSTVEALNIIT
jgi:hypothetical protein